MAILKKSCKVCGQEFEVTDGEQTWYAERDWDVPNKCKDCRNKAKEARKSRNKKKEG